MKIGFYSPSYLPEKDIFGSASLGMTGNEDALVSCLRRFPYDIQGRHIYGTYDQCLSELKQSEKAQAAIVLFGNAGGENGFLREWNRFATYPIVGGGAAMDTVNNKKGLISHGSEANILLINDERFNIHVSYKNIHDRVLGEHRLALADARRVESIDGCEPIGWLASQKKKLGIADTDFEHMTFSTKNGINAHLSVSEGKLVSGRDLEETMLLRYVDHADVYQSMLTFYDDHDAIVFGCAGLKGLLETKMKVDTLGLFMFGEVCAMPSGGEFGNLMLSKIRFDKR